MNDIELVELIEQYAPLVKKHAYEVWDNAGKPPGVQPRDLYTAGGQGLLEAVQKWEADTPVRQVTIPLKARLSTQVRTRTLDGLRKLQVGAVTTKKVARPDGTVGYFRYAVPNEAVTVGEDKPLGTVRTGRRSEVRRLQKRMQQNAGTGDFQDRTAARMDYADAVSQIPDRVDPFVLHVFEQVQLLSPGSFGHRSWIFEAWPYLTDTWSRRKTALAVTQHMLEPWMLPDQVAAHLERAAAWINAYCGGRPLSEYPAFRAFSAQGFGNALAVRIFEDEADRLEELDGDERLVYLLAQRRIRQLSPGRSPLQVITEFMIPLGYTPDEVNELLYQAYDKMDALDYDWGPDTVSYAAGSDVKYRLCKPLTSTFTLDMPSDLQE